MTIQTGWIIVVFGLFSAILVIAGAFAVFRAQYFRTQLDDLRGDRDDLTKRIERLEQESADKDKTLAEVQLALKTEQDKVKVLEGVVSGKEQLENIEHALNEMSDKFDNRGIAIQKSLKAINDKLELAT